MKPTEIKEKCEHNWTISSFEQYLDVDGFNYCYVICIKCGEVKRQRINNKIKKVGGIK